MTPTPTIEEIRASASPWERASYLAGAQFILPLLAERDAEIVCLTEELKAALKKNIELCIKNIEAALNP